MPSFIDQEQIANRRNNFYRDSYRKLLSLLVLFIIIGIGLSVTLGYLTMNPTRSKYFASTENGDVIPLFSLSEPVITDTYLLQWAGLLARQVYNLNFDQLDQQEAALQKSFTKVGWQAYQHAVTQSNLVGSVKSSKLIVSAVEDGAAVIASKTIVEGRFHWAVQLPLLVTYTSASQVVKERLMITLIISRVPVLSVPHGILVEGFQAKRRLS